MHKFDAHKQPNMSGGTWIMTSLVYSSDRLQVIGISSLSFTQNRQEILKKKWVSASVEHRDSMCVLALTGPCVYRSCSDDLAHES